MTDPISYALCRLFAVCVSSAAPQPAAPPQWVQTAAIAVPLIHAWEGRPCQGDTCAAYLDTIASPPVPTICDGITRYSNGAPVRMGDVRTPAECDAEFEALVERVYWRGWRTGLTEIGLATLTVHADGAFTSLTWNIGVGAVQRSTATRRVNAGDLVGACEAGTWFDRAGGRQVPGLLRRRGCEYRVCVGEIRMCAP